MLTIEGSDGRIAQTVVQSAGGDRPVLTLNAMQGTMAEGDTYLSVMEDNLTVLRLAIAEAAYGPEKLPGVAINEAVELAKKFGQDESSGFVNGVLARFV